MLAEERRTDLPGLPAGGWLSAFDGYSTDDPSELAIDHTVPLAEAWRSGQARGMVHAGSRSRTTSTMPAR